jgi:two-component system nitrogen regulation response regulator GlnG
MRALAAHTWPGNVRELRNLLEMASYSDRRPLELASFLHYGRRQERTGLDMTSRYSADRPFKEAKGDLLLDFEHQYLTDLLERHDGNVSQAARSADIERAYLQRLVRKHGLR